MNKYCCDVFPKIAKTFDWFSTRKNNPENAFDNSEEDVILMPYIQGVDKFRINYCPSCGKEIRDIEIKLSEFEKL